MAGDMVVGIGMIELWIGGSQSLKDKRAVLSRVLKRTQNAFNVSIAEIGDNDHRRRARIGFSVVGNDRRYINGKVDKIVGFIEDLQGAEVVGRRVDILNVSSWPEPPPVEEDKYDAV